MPAAVAYQSALAPSSASFIPWLVAVVMATGCATMRPVPAGNEPVAQADVAGVVITVPRLDSGEYPGDVLDVATAVMVVIENRSDREILIEPERFLLGPPGWLQQSPIAPQNLALKETSPSGLQEGTLLASRGPVHVAPPARGPIRVAPPVRVPVSGWRGGYYTPRSLPYAHHRWHHWRSGPLYWGPTWWVGWYGAPWFGPWFYDGPRAYAWSRADAIRLALPAGRLPPGGRTGGFLYFPRMEHAKGMPLVLQWPIREAAGQQVIGTLNLSLEMRAD